MARLEWVDTRLRNWERWQCQMSGGGLGFATQAAFLNDHPGTEREVRIPIDEVEASITHDAVDALKEPRPQLYQVLWCIYPFGLGPAGTARRLGVSTSNVHALLGVADRVLANWFTERAAKQEELRAAIKRSFTT
jgi:hypothetical protein